MLLSLLTIHDGMLGLQVTQMMQELSEYYQKLANETNMLCTDTDVGLISKLSPSAMLPLTVPQLGSYRPAPPCPALPCPAPPCRAPPRPVLPCPALS